MIQTLWFFFQMTLVIGVAVWLSSRPGSVSIDVMDYTFTIQAGVFFILLLALFLVTLFIFRAIRAVFSVPGAIAHYHEKDKRKKGYRALTRGLVAVAAGDAKKATKFSQQASDWMAEKNGLPMLLKAQAARLRGEEGLAQNHFKELMKDKDAAFLGIRGLLKAALEEGNIGLALEYARQALILHPKQGWVLRAVYDLMIKNQLWDDALQVSTKAVKYNGLSPARAASDRVAIHLMRYDEMMAKGDGKKALGELEKAYKLDSNFVPTVTRLARVFIAKKNKRKAASIVEKAWKVNPHPELAEIWDALAQEGSEDKNAAKKLKWYEDLVAFKPDSAEGQMAAARAAMDLGYWGEAKAYLMVAERIYPTARLFRLRAIVEQNSTHNEEAIHQLMEKASEALPDKTWTCKETGLTYNEWSPIAMPHESFNTIIWGLPQARIISGGQSHILGGMQNALLIDPAA